MNNSTVEQSIVGSIYLGLSVLYLLPYFVCVYVIVKDKKLMSQPYYHIIVHMAVADMVQLIFNGMVSGRFEKV